MKALQTLHYYLCAYGHVIRVSNLCKNKKEAAITCFGTTKNVSVINMGVVKPIKLSKAMYNKYFKELTDLHESKTGVRIN